MATHLVSFVGTHASRGAFANKPLLARRQMALHQSALRYGGVDECHAWSFERLQETAYYRANVDLLNRPKGCGYWAWKPTIILDALNQAAEGDAVVYCDVGKPLPHAAQDHGNLIDRSLQPLVDWAAQNQGFMPGVYLPHHGPASHWIKRDCFKLMGCDTEEFHRQPTVQAGYTVWHKTPAAIAFLNEWMQLNLDSRLITDDANQLGEPNLPGFQRHCHDQATLTLLCHKRGATAFGDPRQQFWGFRNINYIALEAARQLRHLRKQEGDLPIINWVKKVPLFPSCLRRWLDLLFGDKLAFSLRVTTTEPELLPVLPSLFHAGSHSYTQLSALQETAQTDLLMVTNLHADDATAATLAKAYRALSDDGVLLLGPLPQHSEFEDCARYVSEHGHFPNRPEFAVIDPELDCPKIPNSRNPIFVSSQQGKFCIMIKPRSVANLHQAMGIANAADAEL